MATMSLNAFLKVACLELYQALKNAQESWEVVAHACRGR